VTYKRKVIDGKYLPMRFPIVWSIAVWLMIDRYRPPGWVIGMVATLAFFVWAGAIIGVFTQEATDIKDLK
jgi:hypothetical protein